MSALDRVDAAPANAEANQRSLRKLARAWRDDNNPYSPVMCVLMLLIAGLVVKLGPAIHELLAQN
jgi:hypothetical protein